jgi:H+-transporting ATPase
MTPKRIDHQSAKEKDLDELFEELKTDDQGLSRDEAERRLSAYGPNIIEEKRINPIFKFLGYFWGPIPWMIEIAALLSAVVQHWVDMIIILVMLAFNAVVGFWQEYQASNALDALKEQLALKARGLRDGKWKEISARELVPGDVIRLRAGDIIPADVKLFNGDYLSVDESSLTGESLPVDKKQGDIAYSGSVAKQGEMACLVTGTGGNTFFARTAKLVEEAGTASHFQKAVLTIGDYLIYLSIGLAAALVLAQMFRGDAFLTVFQFILILVVAAIPVAMPAVLSVTMALGALALSKSKAIVSRLQSIEEIAGIDILCSDKTGTLTQNRLTLGDPVLFDARDKEALILHGVLASKEENMDAIDQAILSELEDRRVLDQFRQTTFVPFDPVNKRTESTITGTKEDQFKVSKGAPQVIFDLCRLDPDVHEKASAAVRDFASRGYRTLGVALSDGADEWRLMGILSLYDPPRQDAAETIQRAKAHGIAVKMVTGDNTAIARETSRQLKMDTNIAAITDLLDDNKHFDHLDSTTIDKIEKAGGFAQVFPEHKFAIVKALQSQDHLVAMTGDGVNDAPALKQADVGVAVSGATNAAQAAASLVLTSPGLSVIIQAVEEARRIFERMNSYATYRITETIRIMVFMVLAMIVFNFYPINTIMIILLALLNDLPILTIAYDNTWLNPKPARWDMRRVLTVATVLGLIGVFETFGLLLVGKLFLKLGISQLQSFIYLKLAVAGHLTLFVVRTRGPFWSKPYPSPPLLGAILGTQALAVLIVGFGFLVTPIPWSYIVLVWGYCLVWVFIEDRAKLMIYRHLALSGKHHRSFVNRAQMPFLTHRRP